MPSNLVSRIIGESSYDDILAKTQDWCYTWDDLAKMADGIGCPKELYDACSCFQDGNATEDIDGGIIDLDASTYGSIELDGETYEKDVRISSSIDEFDPVIGWNYDSFTVELTLYCSEDMCRSIHADDIPAEIRGQLEDIAKNKIEIYCKILNNKP